jgi:acetyl esterase/lipase
MAAVSVAVVAVGVGGAPGAPAQVATAATRYLDPVFLPDVQRDVVYGTATAADGSAVQLRLDLYTPRGDTATDRPVFVFAHGGFFFTGDKSTTVAWAQRMAQRGYVAASINYRLGSAPVLYPVDTPTEFQVVNDARADMQTAVRWFRANAASLRIDPDRIAVGGTSAGAVTALGVAANADAPLPGDHDEFSSAVCTAVSFSGANDPAAFGPFDAGAIFHHGEIDTIVPTAQAIATRDAMTAAGLPVAWYEYAGEGHELSDASINARVQPTIQWLYDRVATAAYPCSPAVGQLARVPAGRQTELVGDADRSAVVSLVSVDNVAPGFVQVLPCGAVAGGSSNLNADAAGQIRSGLAVVRFDGSGRACLFNQRATHLVADLQGWFAPGAFDDVADIRLLDTRSAPKPVPGMRTQISGRPNATGVVSIVMTETDAAGYVQVLPCGAAAGGSSNLNADAAGQTRSGLAFVRFDGAGVACLFNQRGTHLVADLQGYMVDGSFDDVTDERVLDTRAGVRPGDASVTSISGRAGATAVVSIVATDTSTAGYVQVLPCGAAPGGSSNLNTEAAGQTIAGLAFVRFGDDGRVCVFAQRSAHLVVDVQGYLSGGAFVDVPDDRLLDTRTRS